MVFAEIENAHVRWQKEKSAITMTYLNMTYYFPIWSMIYLFKRVVQNRLILQSNFHNEGLQSRRCVPKRKLHCMSQNNPVVICLLLITLLEGLPSPGKLVYLAISYLS